MQFMSLTTILTVIFLVYVAHTIWTLAEIFIPPECKRGVRCFSSYLSAKPVQNLVLFTSVQQYPQRVTKVHTALNFDYLQAKTFDISLRIPPDTRNNGTLFMHVMLLDDGKLYNDFNDLKHSESIHTLPLVTYVEPQAETYNLLNQQENESKKQKKTTNVQPFSHLATKVPISILTDELNLPVNKIPGELYPYIRNRNKMFLPIILHNTLKSRLSQLKLIDPTTKEVNITIDIAPASFGVVRLALTVGHALEHLKSLGFTEKDVDDVKGIFADTNLYLLSATVLIASFHLLFDFLAFKNDVSFWRRKQTMAGLSSRTVLWRAFSQCVILLYLVDEKTSLLVLVPAAISVIIELWKAKKVLRIQVVRSSYGFSLVRAKNDSAAEKRTAAVDAEAMKYLSMLLYPLCIVGAIYTLVYEQQKSWYSWALHSVVNGVYAFGFLFMLPQLFVNYRLRSVAALPWRAFMYKAFNTFIDDIFAFVITMPTAHRVACFRDDLVFLVYLYQRWLYPVDASRTDSAVSMDEAAEQLIPADDKEKTD